MININLVNRKLVKPCTPTPQNLQNYKFSFTDELIVQNNKEVGVLLFYADGAAVGGGIKVYEESLSKVLVQFYPLAGRYMMKDRCVDCSDQGAELVEAEAPDVDMATLIKERDLENLAGLFPRKSHQVDEASYPLLSIQITKLKSCGGVVIGISVVHKIFDASSLSTFIAAWSSASKDEIVTITPVFNSSSLFPLFKNRNNYIVPAGSGVFSPIADISRVSVKRFTFNKEAINKLRSNLRPREGKRGWSKVRVVSSFIAKAFLGVDRTKHGGTSRPCFIVQVANIRERTIPPLPNHSCGNLLLSSYLHCMDTRDMGLQQLADATSEEIDKCVANCSLMLSVGEDGLHKLMVDPSMKASISIQSGDASFVFFTDWSKFGFYEADFGWGKPVWASLLPTTTKNGVVLMASEEGNGIEAWVYLEKNDMVLFEQDDEIRLLANLAS